MSKFKKILSRPGVRKAAIALPIVALMLIAATPASAGDAAGGAIFGTMYTTMNTMQGGLKTIVAVVGFIVALVSLVALRSFTAVLFFLGLTVFGSAGLAVAEGLMGAPLSLL